MGEDNPHTVIKRLTQLHRDEYGDVCDKDVDGDGTPNCFCSCKKNPVKKDEILRNFTDVP